MLKIIISKPTQDKEGDELMPDRAAASAREILHSLCRCTKNHLKTHPPLLLGFLELTNNKNKYLK